jgi:hypothetical protein
MALQVIYCGVCGLPPEYCEFGPDFEKCKPWIQANCPSVYPELFGRLLFVWSSGHVRCLCSCTPFIILLLCCRFYRKQLGGNDDALN